MSESASATGEYLDACRDVYEALMARLDRQRGDERRLVWAGLIAKFAWHHHPGFYSDGRLEDAVADVASRVGVAARERDGDGRDLFAAAAARRVLHVVTEAPPVGGHVRLLRTWIERDEGSSHAVVLTRQLVGACAGSLAALLVARRIPLRSVCDAGGLRERVVALRSLVDAASPDIVLLHHHPDDPVTVAAFAREGGPPVGLVNHADHCFWLGVSVADVVINFRAAALELSRERRHARATTLLPFPIADAPPLPSRSIARARLGVSPDSVLLLSIGSAMKYRQTRRHDFFRTMRAALDAYPSARVHLVGPTEREVPVREMGFEARLRCFGIVPEPIDHLAAADIYVESFPYGSFTALLEAALVGLPVLLMFDPIPQLAIAPDSALDGVVDNPRDETDYLAALGALIRDAERRRQIGRQVREAVARGHASGWRPRLESVYARLMDVVHRVAAIPAARPMRTDYDFGIADFGLAQQAFTGTPLFAQVERRALTFPDAMALLARSLRRRDTRPTPRHLAKWASRLGRGLANSCTPRSS